MTQLLEDMERLLSDLMQAGFSTGGPSAGQRAEKIAGQCEVMGLHTASEILSKIGLALCQRAFQAEKDDRELMANICAAVGYIELAREQLRERQIEARWQEQMDNREGENT